jgi:3-deoxy-D-manno-octulosonate 8-phosphate phosphatase (KDO 8-P phosphatase)
MTEPDLKCIRLLICDVDGVLTDGRIIYDANGVESKNFYVRDGQGIRHWLRAGGKMAWLSGRKSGCTDHRAAELGVETVVQGSTDKLTALRELAAKFGVTDAEIAFIGDDSLDIPPMQAVGFAAAPADAHEDVRRVAHYICKAAGGRGAVREVIDRLLRARGAGR